MKDKIFVDTNLWIYLYAKDEISEKVKNIINKDFENIKISVQILGEIFHVLTKKRFKEKEETKQIILDLTEDFNIVGIFQSTVIKAIEINKKYNYSYWDSLVIGSALENNCSILYTEDMQDEQVIDGSLTIINPLK